MLLGWNLEAQSVSIRGRVVDSSDLPLPGAVVYLAGNTIGTVTDANGFYRLSNLPGGEHSLEVQYIGYETVSEPLSVTEGTSGTYEYNFKLTEGIQLQEVKVSGSLQGRVKAMNSQKSSVNINNVIASDQVERFPDANIGDALKRIPGINVQYDQGEARFGHIRGTASEYNSVTINGERMPSAEAEIRSVQLDLIPAEMVQMVEVNKVVTPDMEGDAIGGSVNLITRSNPVSRRISGQLGSGYNFLMSKPMTTGSLMYGDRFFDQRLGLVIAGSYHNHRLGSDNIEAEWDRLADKVEKPESLQGDERSAVFASDFQVRTYHVQRERQSYSMAMDYAFTNNHRLEAKGIYNRRKDWENRFRLNYKDIEVIHDGDDNVLRNDDGSLAWQSEIRRETKGGVEENKYRRLEDQTVMSYSLGGEHHFGNVGLDWNAAYSKASEERPNERYLNFRAKEASVQPLLGDTRKPNMLGRDADVADLNGNFDLKDLTEEYQKTEDIDRSFGFNLSLPLSGNGENSMLSFGGKLKQKEKMRTNDFYEHEPLDEDAFLQDALSAGQLKDMTRSDFMAGDYKAGSFSKKEFLGDLELDGNAFEREQVLEELAGNFEAEEQIYAAFLRYDQRWGKKLQTVAGVRYEQTKVDYKGFTYLVDEMGDEHLDPSGSRSEDYGNVLPSLLLKYNVSDDLKIKAAWSNTLSRPRYFDLVPYRQVNYEDMEISIGNPDLVAATSMNLDLMGEWYLSGLGLVSAGAFYKDINDFFVKRVYFDYGYEGKEYKTFSQPINGGDAQLFGFEAAFERRLDFLPGFLANLGVYTNYTHTKSKVKNFQLEGRDDDEVQLPGTPEHAFNASLDYESKKLTLRASLNYSGSFVDEFGEEAFYDRHYDKARHLDLSGSYDISSNFKFYAEAKQMHNKHLPALTRINNLESNWQQSIFYLRSYTQHKNHEYYQKAQESITQTEYWCNIQMQESSPETKALSDSIQRALKEFKSQSQKIEQAIEGIDQNYNKLNTAINNLQSYSDNYLQLQYQKLKNDVDKEEQAYIIKRRADKIELMSQIVATAMQLKTSIGEANFNHNYSLLDTLPASLNLVNNNLAILRPITTKNYDLEAMDAIEDLANTCKEAINNVIASYTTSSRITDHSNNQKDLSLVHKLRTITEQEVLDQAASYQDQTQRAQIVWWMIILLVGACGVILAHSLSASLSKPLINLAKISAYQEQGYFPKFERLARKDEIGTLTNIMQSGQEKTRNLVENLQSIASTIDRLINQLHLRSVKLDKASITLSGNSQSIANNLNSIALLSETNARSAASGVSEIKQASLLVNAYTQQTKHSLSTLQVHSTGCPLLLYELASLYHTFMLSILPAI